MDDDAVRAPLARDRKAASVRPGGEVLAILLIFTRLGCTSFGGPVAHLGYFRAAFVERRRWLSERAYADLVAVCQFLPGPASSQTGFGIGLLRGGLLGGVAAWIGFTLPSAVLLVLFAYGAGRIADHPAGAGLLHGLKLVAVAIVAQAVMGMARNLCPDRAGASITTGALVVLLVAPSCGIQAAVIAAGGLAGWWLCRGTADPATDGFVLPVSRRAGGWCLAVFLGLLALTFVPVGLATGTAGPWLTFAAFYRAGALVFGGGHVVLPLLRDAVVTPGWVSDGTFLAGYGAAQTVPGPLFTFAAYLGALSAAPPAGVLGAALALAGVSLPGLLCLLGVLPFWHALRGRLPVRAAMQGANAAVVGLLGAALYDPVWTSAIHAPADLAIAATAFVLLIAWRAPPLLVVGLAGLAGVGQAWLGVTGLGVTGLGVTGLGVAGWR